MSCREFTPAEQRSLEIAAGIAFSFFPYLSGIFAKLDIRFDDRIKTAAVTPSGKLLLNHGFFAELAPGLETAFILAHEMLHLAQMIFERGKAFPDQESLNIAHDILINELLCDTMQVPRPPLGGLTWQWFLERYPVPEYDAWWMDANDTPWRHPIPNLPTPAEKASAYSLEEMVRIIVSVKDSPAEPPHDSWQRSGTSTGDVFTSNPFTDIFDSGAKKPAEPPKPAGKREPAAVISLDMVPEEMEDKFFPDEDKSGREKAAVLLREACQTAAVKNALLSSPMFNNDQGTQSGNLSQAVEIVRSFYVPPWEMAMQRWFDGVAAPRRSWARASRHGAWRRDIVLPGRTQECYTLHIVLDTSGSMNGYIPRILEQISSFARNTGLAQAHIMQCDTRITADEFVDIDRLDKYRISGYGDSDMSPAMRKLAEDPDVTSVLVITDGYIDHPPAWAIPYDVLWCLPESSRAISFPYGKVIHIPIPEGE